MISRFVVGAALLGLLAGCTSDWDPGRAARLAAAGDADVPQSGDGFLRIASASRAAALSGSAPFASLPDRGELLAYDRGAKPRISGAYRAYSVRLSEEHALKAAHEGGQIELVAPNGEPIELAYERHIEHPDGNWTWIGRDASGADAVITFGAKAVFGSVPFDGQEPLRLTMAGGRSWLVETDGDKVVDADHAAMRASGKPDFFIPPKLAVGAAADKAIAASAQATKSAAAAAAAQTTVDVLLGYTNGFATAQGGQSQAITRLTNLIDIANQAYSNSGITARLRLVGTVAVAYTDANDNGLALEKLSGFDDDGPITPDPAFAALRAARNTLGADLVSLVRDFRTPENAGCGIAWLIGGDLTPIVQADEPYGYSVVSDGSDVDEGDGNTYFCRDESLAHEFGHNMGQAHNAEDSSSAGAHAYSYGYRESTTNGFYTVMAYRLAGSSQFAIRHFANPNVQYQSRPTGVANQSDNARSLNQTIPIIATFRAMRSTKHNDVDGDGKSDLVWRGNGASNNLQLWLMNGQTLRSTLIASMTAGYALSATGDFNGDGKLDLVWRNGTSTQLRLWLGGGNGGFAGYTLNSTFGAGWEVAAAGDIDGDGKSDLIWRGNGASNNVVMWLMDGQTIRSALTATMVAGHALSTTGDFNGDGKLDLVWRNGASTQLRLWLGGGNGGFAGYTLSSSLGTGWEVGPAGDIDGDGKSDLIMRGNGTGNNVVMWLMNGQTIRSTLTASMVQGHSLSTTGDFNGDGKLDLVWRNGTSTQLRLWLGGGTGGFAGYTLSSSLGGGWSVIR